MSRFSARLERVEIDLKTMNIRIYDGIGDVELIRLARERGIPLPDRIARWVEAVGIEEVYR